jgi:hypothetical protein
MKPNRTEEIMVEIGAWIVFISLITIIIHAIV